MSPRGNDAESAVHDLADKFGRGVGNAEELIEATLRHRSQLLIKAERLPVDEKATADLDLSKLKGPDGERVVDAKVRGDITVIVFEDKRGSYRLAALDEKGKVVAENAQHPPLPASIPEVVTPADEPKKSDSKSDKS